MSTLWIVVICIIAAILIFLAGVWFGLWIINKLNQWELEGDEHHRSRGGWYYPDGMEQRNGDHSRCMEKLNIK